VDLGDIERRLIAQMPRRILFIGVAATFAIVVTALFVVMLGGGENIRLARAIAGYERIFDTYSQTDTTVTDVTSTQHADGREAHLISAFFGLDNGLPERLTDRVACEGAGGADGMPVIFSHEVDIATLEPGDFKITTQSGAVFAATCLTLAPADDPGELRTALLAGEYGSVGDEPVTVQIIGNVLSLDGTVNYKGASVDVTPLEAGPSLVWAEFVPETQWDLGGKATTSPWGAAIAVRWAPPKSSAWPGMAASPNQVATQRMMTSVRSIRSRRSWPTARLPKSRPSRSPTSGMATTTICSAWTPPTRSCPSPSPPGMSPIRGKT